MASEQEAVEAATGAADGRTVQSVDPSSWAAIEKRCLPGFRGVTAITADGTIVHLSPSLDGRFGVDAAGAVGRNFVEFVDLADADQAIDSFGGVLSQPGFHPAIELRVGNGGDSVMIDAVAENRLDTELGVVVMHIADARDRSLASHLLSAQVDVMRAIALGDSLTTGLSSVTGFVETALPGFGAVAYVFQDGRYVGHGDGLAAERRVHVERALVAEQRYVGAAALVDAEPKLAQAGDDCELWPIAGP
jgi:hypothetical protein